MKKKFIIILSLLVFILTAGFAQLTPKFVSPGPEIAKGQAKYLGCAHSAPQKINFNKYWNQVTPENGGKWGAVEGTRGVFNWADLDSAYNYAKNKDRNYSFKMHNLIWGAQQPTWIETLPADVQLAEIKIWFKAVADRYPGLDYIDVVNEPLHAAPSTPGQGNYINALGGSGVTGWDWVITSYQLARFYFPNSKLLINDYNLLNDTAESWKYVKIINLLKDRGLIDGVGNQAHAPEMYGTPIATIKRNLDIMATPGLPMFASELDIDGDGAVDQGGVHVVNPVADTIQLNEYKRVFPTIWTHPAIAGITLWGYLPGHWRSAQGAYIAYSDGTERPALIWLRKYVQSFNIVLPVTITSFDALKNNAAVKIIWTASNEVNNNYFGVERSVDGVNFLQLFNVKSDNTNLFSKDYAAMDATPVNGKNFYRIAQTDQSGKKVYSAVKMVDMSKNEKTPLQVYPNPAFTSFTIKAATSTNQNRIIDITDLSGKLVKTFTLSTSGIKNISTSDLPNGTYLIRVTNNANYEVTKIVVNK